MLFYCMFLYISVNTFYEKEKYLSADQRQKFFFSQLSLLFCVFLSKMNSEDMTSVNKAINNAFVDLKGISTSDGYKKAQDKSCLTENFAHRDIFSRLCRAAIAQMRVFCEADLPAIGEAVLKR